MEQVVAAFVSAVVGGLVVLVGGRASERRQAQYERETRWLADRRALYAAFLRAMYLVHRDVKPTATKHAEQEFENAHQTLTSHWGELALLAPPRVMELADGIRDWSEDMGITLRRELANETQRSSEWEAMQQAYWVLRRDLIDECRRDLGIPLAETLEHVMAKRYPLPIYHPDVD